MSTSNTTPLQIAYTFAEKLTNIYIIFKYITLFYPSEKCHFIDPK